MRYLELGLAREGYETCNMDYPSRDHDIESLVTFVKEHLLKLDIAQYDKVYILGHSLGGVIGRCIAIEMGDEIEGCIALGSPNNGSSLAQWMVKSYMIRRYFGPVMFDLLPRSSFLSKMTLLPKNYSVIVGTRSKWTLFGWFFEEVSDGTVSVSEVVPEKIDLEDVCYFDVSHASMLMSSDVRDEVLKRLDGW